MSTTRRGGPACVPSSAFVVASPVVSQVSSTSFPLEPGEAVISFVPLPLFFPQAPLSDDPGLPRRGDIAVSLAVPPKATAARPKPARWATASSRRPSRGGSATPPVSTSGRATPSDTRPPAIGPGGTSMSAVERTRCGRRGHGAFDLQAGTGAMRAGSGGAFGQNDGDIEVVSGPEAHLLQRAVFPFASGALLLVRVHRVAVARLGGRIIRVGKDRDIGQIPGEDGAELLGLEAATAADTRVGVDCAEGVFCEWVLEVSVVGRGDGAQSQENFAKGCVCPMVAVSIAGLTGHGRERLRRLGEKVWNTMCKRGAHLPRAVVPQTREFCGVRVV